MSAIPTEAITRANPDRGQDLADAQVLARALPGLKQILDSAPAATTEPFQDAVMGRLEVAAPDVAAVGRAYIEGGPSARILINPQTPADFGCEYEATTAQARGLALVIVENGSPQDLASFMVESSAVEPLTEIAESPSNSARQDQPREQPTGDHPRPDTVDAAYIAGTLTGELSLYVESDSPEYRSRLAAAASRDILGHAAAVTDLLSIAMDDDPGLGEVADETITRAAALVRDLTMLAIRLQADPE